MARKNKKKQSSHSLDPELSQGILAIVLVGFAIFIILAFFNSAGPAGAALNDYVLSALFGHTRYATPFVLVALAWFLVKDQEYNYRKTHLIGSVLFFLTFSSLLHIGFATEDMWRFALEGRGGGLFGMGAWLAKTYLGIAGGIVVLLVLFLISVLLVFNTAITHFILLHKKFMEKFGSVGEAITGATETLFVPDEEDEEEEEIYEEDEEYDDEEEEPAFVSKRLGHEDDEDEEVDEEEEEVPKKAPAKKQPVSTAKEDTGGLDEATYMQNIIIKKIPPTSLLSSKKGKPTSGDIKANAKMIKDTLADFRIDVDMGEAKVGPTVTQFTLKPPKGVKLSRLTSLSNNLALALAAHPIRMEAPIPGTSLVGIEVPNEKAAHVSFRELLESKEFQTREHNMMIALGKDVGGKVWFADLPRMPHLLVAGATGSGKTVCVNTMLLSLLYQNTAETLRLILVDPKRVELTPYNGIPHLLTPVITDAHKTVNALKWTIGEMDRRFEVFAKSGNRDIGSYNSAHPDKKMPHIVFVIDELADLMQTAGNEVEAGIIRLAQMARAVGIHLVLATQRPSVDVITGLMKANIPGRIAFSVASLTDSRTILDAPGAEKLLGRGDMLLSTASLSKPVRIQGSFISEAEVKRVIEYLKGDEEPEYDASIVDAKANTGTMSMFGGPTDNQDPLFAEAKTAILEAGKASASFLQRRLRVGYARAARILDELEEAGVIGPADGSKPRDILITEMDVDHNPGMGMGGEVNVYDDEEDDFADEEEEEDDMEADEDDQDFDEDQEELYDEDESDEEIDDEEDTDNEEDWDEADDEDSFEEDEDEDDENYDEEEDEDEDGEEDEKKLPMGSLF